MVGGGDNSSASMLKRHDCGKRVFKSQTEHMPK
jgi:hypothetical protein